MVRERNEGRFVNGLNTGEMSGAQSCHAEEITELKAVNNDLRAERDQLRARIPEDRERSASHHGVK